MMTLVAEMMVYVVKTGNEPENTMNSEMKPARPGRPSEAKKASPITAAYYLWAIHRMFLGKLNVAYKGYPDLNWRERMSLYPLGAFAVMLGFYPQFILNAINGSLHALIQNIRPL